MKRERLAVPPAPPIDRDADKEPATDIELLGAMIVDNQTMGILLRELPYERAHYRSNLRMVLGAAVRMRDRCRRLLEEGDPIKDVHFAEIDVTPGLSNEDTIERAGAAVAGVTGRRDPAPAAAEAEGDELLGHEAIMQDPETLAEPRNAAAADSGLTRNNGARGPKKTGRTVVESFLMAELKDRGTATTKELVEWVAQERRVPQAEVTNALAELRRLKLITTTRLGKGLINRIAE